MADDVDAKLAALTGIFNVPVDFTRKLGGHKDIQSVYREIKERKRKKKASDKAKQEKEKQEKEKQEAEQEKGKEEEEETMKPHVIPNCETEAQDEDKEPEAFERGTMQAKELPAIEFGLLDLASYAAKAGSKESEPSHGLVLLMGTCSVLQYQGNSAQVLQALYQILSFSAAPAACLMALSQLIDYYSNQTAAWAPSVSEVYASLVQLGYCELGVPGPGGSRKRKAAATPPQESPAAEPCGSHQEEKLQPQALPLLRNVQCLLRLFACICRLHVSGRLKMDFSTKQQVAGKSLILALMRLRMDPAVAPFLLRDIIPAMTALFDAWGHTESEHPAVMGSPTDLSGGAAWRRISADLATQLADFGPSHRASLAAIQTLPALESRKARMLQDVAAMQLLKKLMKADKGGSSSSRACKGNPLEIKEIMFGGHQDTVIKLIKSFKRSSRQRAPDNAKGQDQIDWWRLMTAMEAANIVLWNLALLSEEATKEQGELLQWWSSYVEAAANYIQGGGKPAPSRAKAYLLEMHSNMGCVIKM